jgi:hypothetical protein
MHNHTVTLFPQLFFLHFAKHGTALQMAQTIRTIMNQNQIAAGPIAALGASGSSLGHRGDRHGYDRNRHDWNWNYRHWHEHECTGSGSAAGASGGTTGTGGSSGTGL